MCLGQQNIFALSWLIVTCTDKGKVVNCLILECPFQAICNISYVQHLLMFRCEWMPCWAVLPQCIMHENPADFSLFTIPHAHSIHLVSPSMARVRGVKLSLLTYFKYQWRELGKIPEGRMFTPSGATPVFFNYRKS